MDFSEALKALKIISKKHKYRPKLYTLLGEVYSIKTEFDKSLSYLNKALSYARKNNLKTSEANTLLNISNQYGYLGKPTISIQYLDTVENIYRKINNEKGLARTIVTKAMAYYRLGFYEIAINNFVAINQN